MVSVNARSFALGEIVPDHRRSSPAHLPKASQTKPGTLIPRHLKFHSAPFSNLCMYVCMYLSLSLSVSLSPCLSVALSLLLSLFSHARARARSMVHARAHVFTLSLLTEGRVDFF